MNTKPLWLARDWAATYPPLARNLDVDVLVVGGGIMGVTAAYLLQKAGKTVALVERGRVGHGQSGHTTAHLTCVTDTRPFELAKSIGRNHAAAVWEAGMHAIQQIRATVQQTGIACELRSVPGYLVASASGNPKEERERLSEEANLAAELGFEVGLVEESPLTHRPALRIANQAKFHPAKYVSGLAAEFVKEGGLLFEDTHVTDFQENPPSASVHGCTIRYGYLILATHVPVQGLRSGLSAALFQTKLALYSTYAIEARVPEGRLPEILWWDTEDPYHYLRIDRRSGSDSLIFGGEDHKTGQEDSNTEVCFAKLEKKLFDLVPEATIFHRWSGQVVETPDGLPYIGEAAEGQFIAAGFAGNGMTFGTLAGMMARDAVLGVRNPWSELFHVKRKNLSAVWDYLAENADYPYYLAKGRLSRAEEGGVDLLKPGEGKMVRIDKKKIAAYRDSEGNLHLLSPTCPHLGCTVAWNEAEETWDCPCHGSRFKGDGGLIAGPAEKGLESA